MGVVYRATDPKIGRTVAIKSIRLNELTDPQERARMRERLFREAQSAGILSHPHIVTIYDVSEEDGMAYIFMEFVNGMALDDLLRAVPPPTGELIMDLLAQTAGALDYAHKNGIVHRDIKPANIMVHEGRSAKVCDFGVAKIVSQQMTQAGMLMGTPSYMSPEQIEGRPMDGRSDQFALAVMVFDILTGEKPFTGDSLPILLYKICRAEPPSASGVNTTLGIWVDPVLRKALSKNPDERYPSCTAFIAELRRALDERPGWMLPGKGFPGEDGTTGSGHSSAISDHSTTATPTPAPSLTSSRATPDAPPPAASSVNVPQPTLPPTANPAFTQSGRDIAPPPAPPNPAYQSQNGMPAPTEAIPLPRSRVEHKRSNPLVYAIPLVLAIAAGGYFGYQKLIQPKPPVVEPPPDSTKAVEPAKPSVQKPEAAKPDVAKANEPPPVQKPTVVVEPHSPTDPKPTTAGGTYAVRFVGSPPGAVVTLDSDSATACKTPCAIPLTKGRHTLTAFLEGYRSLSRAIEVTGEGTQPVDLIESLGILVIRSSPPGASISINGQERPEKTPAELRLKPGPYQVVVSRDGQKDASTVNVKDGVPGSLNVSFQQ